MKKLGLPLIAIAVVAGIALWQFAPLLAKPQMHQYIIDNTQIMDTDYHTDLVPHFVASRQSPQLSVVLSQFQPKTKNYDVSEWIWRSNGDPNAFMVIWGPGDDGKSYYIEISKSAGNELYVICFDNSYIMPEGTGQPNGYIGFIVVID